MIVEGGNQPFLCQHALRCPPVWATKNFEDRVFSTADEYRSEGVILRKADNERLTGKRKIATMLAESAPDGLPLLQFTENCGNLVRTLPALPYDKTNVEDVDTDAEDHAYDALRYLLSTINPRPRRKAPVVEVIDDIVLKKLGALQRGNGFGSKDL